MDEEDRVEEPGSDDMDVDESEDDELLRLNRDICESEPFCPERTLLLIRVSVLTTCRLAFPECESTCFPTTDQLQSLATDDRTLCSTFYRKAGR